MGRPPCCDKVGIKKGPWTPEEDIILVTYIQEHGPGNWRSVPTNTGLLRCSKSCRLRWTNYLRPGIKRGNFTPHEEGMIVHLQALWGNKWAAIASYLPQRTDNDIKNYWNTHLKKKMKKLQSAFDSQITPNDHSTSTAYSPTYIPKRSNMSTGKSLYQNIATAKLNQAHQYYPNIYASSTQNISRLLEGWMRSSSSSTTSQTKLADQETNKDCVNDNGVVESIDYEFESVLAFDNGCWDKMMMSGSGDFYQKGGSVTVYDHEKDACIQHERKLLKQESFNIPPLTFFDRWLMDETASQVDGAIEQQVN